MTGIMCDQMLISHTATDIIQQWVFSMVKVNHLVVEAGLKTLTAINTRQDTLPPCLRHMAVSPARQIT